MRKDSLNSLYSSRFVLLQQVLDGIGNFPVSYSGLDSSESDFGSLVSGLNEVGLDTRNGIGSNDDASSPTQYFINHGSSDAWMKEESTYVSPATTG
jgi:hypothetical protein